ncbi:MAG: peptidylprolyl isomerase [Ilumatobacteraceae bacterium]
MRSAIDPQRHVWKTPLMLVALMGVAVACASTDSGVETLRADGAAETTTPATDVDTTTPVTDVDTTTPDTDVDTTTPDTDVDTTAETVAPDTTPPDTTPPETLLTDGSPLPCPAPDGSSPVVQSFPAAPEQCIDLAKFYSLNLETSLGPITIELFPVKAPITTNSIVYLARYHYFDNTICHRVVPAFVVQCGDPTGTGTGGPGYEFVDELPFAGEYQLGTVAMANAGPDTNGSQFFIISGPDGVALPPAYTLFGQVASGMEVVDAINALGTPDQSPSQTVTIISVTVTES